MKHTKIRTILTTMLLLVCAAAVAAQTTEFTYQGNLSESGAPAEGSYDFEFALFDADTGGTQIGPTLTRSNVSVAGGVFSVALDFGDVFPGAARFLEIRVKPFSVPAAREESLGGYTTLLPRQLIRSVPYAVRSISSGTATNALNLGGVAAGQYVLTTDPRLTDARTPTAGSPDYIQNRTTVQPSSDFNISGTGTAGIFNAGTQYNLGGIHILSSPGTNNMFVGLEAGAGNTTGFSNSIFGSFAGESNTIGNRNSFFGSNAGSDNTEGNNNSFFGANTGLRNTIGLDNSFFGSFAGQDNTIGNNNSFFGRSAGTSNTIGSGNSFFGSQSGLNTTEGEDNSFFGADTGLNNTTGLNNSFFGLAAGSATTTGSNNSFFGRQTGDFNTTGGENTFYGTSAGRANTTGSNNTALGRSADLGAGNLSFATAIGSGTIVTSNNTVQLGRDGMDVVRVGTLGASGPTFLCFNASSEIASCSNAPLTDAGAFIQNTTAEQASSNFNISGTGTADIINAATQYNINGFRILSAPGGRNLFVGFTAGQANPTGGDNSFFGYGSGKSNTFGEYNSFFGTGAGGNNTFGNQNSFFGRSAGIQNTIGNDNSFFGRAAGFNNTTGSNNSFFGTEAGPNSIQGQFNSFAGYRSGLNNTTGNDNSFYGTSAGSVNTTGSNNTALGRSADFGAGDLTYATAIGADAVVARSNTIQLGRADGSDDVSTYGRLGIGTDNPVELLDLRFPNSQVVIGDPDCTTSSFGAVGFAATLTCENYSLLGDGNSTYINTPGGAIFFRVDNSTIARFRTSGVFVLNNLGAAGSTQLCRNGSEEVATCSSSIRYKKGVTDFTPGLDIVKRLRPVFFKWKDGGMPDVGLVAEEVSEIEPLLTTEREGRVEGVKYDRLGVVLVNAVKEQQAEIEDQKLHINRQQKEIGKLNSIIDEQTERIEAQERKLERQRREMETIRNALCGLSPDIPLCSAEDETSLEKIQ